MAPSPTLYGNISWASCFSDSFYSPVGRSSSKLDAYSYITGGSFAFSGNLGVDFTGDYGFFSIEVSVTSPADYEHPIF